MSYEIHNRSGVPVLSFKDEHAAGRFLSFMSRNYPDFDKRFVVFHLDHEGMPLRMLPSEWPR